MRSALEITVGWEEGVCGVQAGLWTRLGQCRDTGSGWIWEAGDDYKGGITREVFKVGVPDECGVLWSSTA